MSEVILTVVYVPNAYSTSATGESIAKKFGMGKVWQIDSFRAFGKRKFSKIIIHQPIGC